jgi:hypothetical protein
VTRAAGGRVADPDASTAAAFATDPALFSRDRFHPSSAGYAMIAMALAPTVRAAATACGRAVVHGGQREVNSRHSTSE